jgi:hypothetical protein
MIRYSAAVVEALALAMPRDTHRSHQSTTEYIGRRSSGLSDSLNHAIGSYVSGQRSVGGEPRIPMDVANHSSWFAAGCPGC